MHAHAPLGQHPLQGPVQSLRHILRQQNVQAAAQAALVVGIRDDADPHEEGHQDRVHGQYHRDAPAADSHSLVGGGWWRLLLMESRRMDLLGGVRMIALE